jgi:hypothetical protein
MKMSEPGKSLPVDEAAQLAAQLPELIRGIYYEGWNTS